MNYKAFVLEQESSVVILSINRPEMRNALDDESLLEFKRVIDDIGNLNDARCVVITGIGKKAFCAGSDIEEMLGQKASFFRIHSLLGHRIMEAIERLPQPVIAAISGHAIGGGFDLALACDFRIAADDIKLGLPEVNLNFPGGWGSAYRLPRLIGIAKSKELILQGNIIDSITALNLGLLTKVVPRQLVLDEAKRLAEQLASKDTTALEMAKFLTNNSFNMSGVAFACLESLSNAYSSTFADFHEKMRLFLAKEKDSKKT
jgi:enoyl-CoA hydratase